MRDCLWRRGMVEKNEDGLLVPVLDPRKAAVLEIARSNNLELSYDLGEWGGQEVEVMQLTRHGQPIGPWWPSFRELLTWLRSRNARAKLAKRE